MALTLSIGITENSYSIPNNTSSVTVSVNVSWTGGSWDHNYYTKYVTINGTQYNFNSVKVNPNRTTTGSQTLYSTTVSIGHNSDGTGSVSCYASVKTATGSGTVTASNSKTLTTIPRTSNISISASSVNMGSAITVYSNRKSTSFTHYLYYSIGNGWQRITTGIGDSYSWTVPLSLASSIPSATSRSVSLLLETYSGSTFIGSTSTSFTANVPSSIVPSVSGISVVDNNGYVSEFGGYVQSKSVPKITVNASASYSSISQYKVSFQGNSYISTSNVITLGAISQPGSLNITVTVTDARGRTASKTVSITGLAYTAPSLSISAIRCNSDGIANDEGAYMKVSCMAEIAPIDNKNSKAVTLKYKKKTITDWTTQKTWAVYSVNENIVISAEIDSSYDIQLIAADYFTSANHNALLGTVKVIMDFNTSGKGMAIGKVSEKDGLEVDWDAQFNKTLKVGSIDYTITDEEYAELEALIASISVGVRIIDWIFPVGHIIQTTNESYNPNKIFKGTEWTRIKDRFLLSAGDTYTAGSVGGEASHILTVEEMPNHSHLLRQIGNTSTFYIDPYYTSDPSGDYGIVLKQATTGYISGVSWGGKLEIWPAGGSHPHNNMPPYLTVYTWQRIS